MAPPPAPLSSLSPIKLALLAQQVREQSGPALRADPIAVVGMGCRLPGGVADPEAFWTLMRDGVDAVGDVPPGRWDVEALYDPDPAAPGKTATRWGGFIGAIDGFDAHYFGILPREAERMDPQHRLFLEVAIEALDHAGFAREKLAGSRTGVFVASYYNDYATLEYNDPLTIDARTLTGTVHSVLANRLSYMLDLRGPSVSVDTACSSSLVAVHLACESLRSGESDVALASGVSLMVSEGVMIALSKIGFMSPNGRCKTFDASADGFGRGEGCSAVVLKRLADAVADGDRVLALIRGSAVNQDGRSTVLAAPNGLAQQALIRDALANAQVDPSAIGYIEAHGTGTALGDPIEVEALAATVGQPTPGAGPCLMGAAKANLGHLEAAAGITGLVKCVLVLQKEAIPPLVHFKRLNPHISLEGTRLKVADKLTSWPRGSRPRLIGTSGFGVGGTNAHVVLQEAPVLATEPGQAPAPPYLLPVSAQSEAALRALALRWIERLEKDDASLAALCAMAGERRSHYDHRVAVVGANPAEMTAKLRDFLAGEAHAGLAAGARRTGAGGRLAFVFSGQGQQWFAMGRELMAREAVFREAIEDLDARFSRLASWSLRAELARGEKDSRMGDTEIAQPAIFAIQAALAALWRSWGIEPDGVVGHSIGEIAALHVAGALSRDEAVRIVFHRARIMQRAAGKGAMAAVGIDEPAALELVRAYGAALSIGAVNSPRGVVLSGEPAALTRALADLSARGVSNRALPVNYAFHSAQMRPLGDELESALGRVEGTQAECPMYSTVAGALLESAPDAAYVARNVREPVRFGRAIDSMLADGFDTFLEVSAHPVLAASIAECAAAREQPVATLASLRRARDERESLLQACAGLYASGRAFDWEALQGGPAAVVDLPAYPWQRERHWLRTMPARASRGAPAGWPGSVLPTAGVTIVEGHWPDPAMAWVADHRVGGEIVMPGVALFDAMRLAARQALGADCALREVALQRRMALPEDGDAGLAWQAVVQSARDGGASVALYVRDPAADATWTRIASAEAETGLPTPGAEGRAAAAGSPMDVGAFYRAVEGLGIAFGPTFRTLESFSASPDGGGVRVEATLRAPGSIASTLPGAMHPGLLDGGLQACVAAASGTGESTPRELMLPIAVERYVVHAPMSGDAEVRVRANARWATGRGSLSADITWLDAQGRSLARCEGVRFVRADLEAGAARADPWLHEIDWIAREAASGIAPSPGRWVLLADEGGVARALADALAKHSQHCVLVHRGAVRAGTRTLDPADAAAFDTLFAQGAGSAPLRGVVHLWSLDPPVAGESAQAADLATATSGLHLVQAIARAGGDVQPVFVTAGAQPAEGAVTRPAAAALWGLQAAVAVEHPEFAARAVDLDADSPDIDALALELLQGERAPARVALRSGSRLAPRLVQRRPVPALPNYRLVPGAGGTLDGLQREAIAETTLAPDDVRVQVVATGLNFRDVLIALGMVPRGAFGMGVECAGIVREVGAKVRGLAAGDRVFGFAPGSFGTEVDVPAAFLAPWPAELGSLEQAAALPAAYLTAMMGLDSLAGLKRGQTILIHAGTGGVGMAAVHLALRAGARVFATAGSPAKRARLLAMGVEKAFDSRTLAFPAQVREATGGKGVDVVLNSLAGDFIAASVEAMAERGCFLELGKRDLWSPERFKGVRPEARYIVYDLGESARANPAIVGPMLDAVVAGLRARGTPQALPLLPVRVFDFARASDALRFMAQARHVGKLVLRMPGIASAGAIVRPDGTYLVTGGLGALGMQVARWLAGQGARHLVLVGRGAPSESASTAIDALRSAGAHVTVRQADAADEPAMRTLLDMIAAAMPPLRGVVHAAGALDDGILLQQDAKRFSRVLRGKAHGARVLDALTRTMALDFFVMFSAAGLLLGPAGQGAYAAANAEVDAIAHARRTAGLPATSIAWAMWSEGGMASAMAAAGRDSWSHRGLGWIAPADGLARLERLLREDAIHAAVMPMDWRRFLASLPPGADRAYFSGVAPAGDVARPAAAKATQGARVAAWKGLPAAQRREAVRAHAAEQALAVLGLGAGTVLDPRMALKDAGLDSLMAVELRNALARSTGHALPATLLFDHPSLEALTAYLLRTLGLAEEASAATGDATQAQRDAIADEVKQLSDAEAEALLLAELDGTARTGS